MIEDPVAEHREVTEVVFTAADLISGSSESERAKVSETLLNILEGRVRNSNTRKAYKAAWRSFFEFCSEYKFLASGLGSNPSAPLLPAFGKNKKTPELRHMGRTSVWKLVQARAHASGFKKRVCCHSFRATGITEYMNAGGALDIAQRIAGHSELSTTKIYDRSQDRVTIAEIERVSFEASSELT